MTKQDDSATTALRDGPAEIELTPAMIEAGALAICDYDPESESASGAAVRVFLAMRSATATA